MNIDQLKTELLCLTEDFRQKGYFPSATVSVTDPKETLLTFSVGEATSDSLFDLASVTKICTSTMMLLAIDEKRLSLDTPLLSVLPELSRGEGLKERLKDITMFRLLTHTAGLPDWYPFYADGRDFTTALAAACKGTHVEGMVYSDLGFILLGKVLERLYEQKLDSLLKTRLSVPYRLAHLGYLPDDALPIVPSSFGNPIEEEMCKTRGFSFAGFRPHTPVRGAVNDGNAYYYLKGVSGHAGVFAPAEGLNGLIRLYLNTSSPLLIDAMREHAPTRGLGFQVNNMYPKGCGHTGFTGTALYICREKGIGCTALTNRLFYEQPNPHATNDFRRALFKALFNAL